MRSLLRTGVSTLILTSGTLTPLSSFASELGVPFPTRLENGHVIGPSQIWAGVVPLGPLGGALNSSYRTRDSLIYKQNLGLALVNFCRIVPDGLLVFFPSYGALDAALQAWQLPGPSGAPSIWDQITRWKHPVIEPREAALFPDACLQYKAILAQKLGAVFLAVCRGKASEGLDFADAAARGVVVTGIPFAMAMDPRVVIKRRLLDEARVAARRDLGHHPHDGHHPHPQPIGEMLSGEAWYLQQASRAVNQAIGRVIRHRRDYGAILLCDERFGREQTIHGLSRWVQGAVAKHQSFGPVMKSLTDFFKSHGAPIGSGSGSDHGTSRGTSIRTPEGAASTRTPLRFTPWTPEQIPGPAGSERSGDGSVRGDGDRESMELDPWLLADARRNLEATTGVTTTNTQTKAAKTAVGMTLLERLGGGMGGTRLRAPPANQRSWVGEVSRRAPPPRTTTSTTTTTTTTVPSLAEAPGPGPGPEPQEPPPRVTPTASGMTASAQLTRSLLSIPTSRQVPSVPDHARSTITPVANSDASHPTGTSTTTSTGGGSDSRPGPAPRDAAATVRMTSFLAKAKALLSTSEHRSMLETLKKYRTRKVTCEEVVVALAPVLVDKADLLPRFGDFVPEKDQRMFREHVVAARMRQRALREAAVARAQSESRRQLDTVVALPRYDAWIDEPAATPESTQETTRRPPRETERGERGGRATSSRSGGGRAERGAASAPSLSRWQVGGDGAMNRAPMHMSTVNRTNSRSRTTSTSSTSHPCAMCRRAVPQKGHVGPCGCVACYDCWRRGFAGQGGVGGVGGGGRKCPVCAAQPAALAALRPT